MANQEWLDSLSEEQRTKLAECEDPQAMLDYVAAEGIALPDEALEDVAGGVNFMRAIGEILKDFLIKKVR